MTLSPQRRTPRAPRQHRTPWPSAPAPEPSPGPFGVARRALRTPAPSCPGSASRLDPPAHPHGTSPGTSPGTSCHRGAGAPTVSAGAARCFRSAASPTTASASLPAGTQPPRSALPGRLAHAGGCAARLSVCLSVAGVSGKCSHEVDFLTLTWLGALTGVRQSPRRARQSRRCLRLDPPRQRGSRDPPARGGRGMPQQPGALGRNQAHLCKPDSFSRSRCRLWFPCRCCAAVTRSLSGRRLFPVLPATSPRRWASSSAGSPPLASRGWAPGKPRTRRLRGCTRRHR